MRAASERWRKTVPVETASNEVEQGSGARGAAGSVLFLLAGSAVAVAFAPVVLDNSYSWMAHTTSDAAGQGVQGAWLTRLGFVTFGLGVLWLSHWMIAVWRRPATALHVVFGSCLMAVAAFSLRSWQVGAPYDRTEDLLHSVAATVMGFAFALGVVAVGARPGRPASYRVLDLVAIAVSVVIPLSMAASGEHSGALQRAMFAVAYLWYATEALGLLRNAEGSGSP